MRPVSSLLVAALIITVLALTALGLYEAHLAWGELFRAWMRVT